MAKQISDEEQNIKRKARRRFIGAFALTLAVVVILPMVLDSEPRPTGRDIELRIPPADGAGEFSPKISASGVPAALPASVPPNNPAMTPPKQPEKVTAATVDVQPAGKGEPAVNQKTTAMNAPVAEGYVAQVGAYSNAETAKQELDKLKKWGFKAYTEKAGGMIRVRVGPYADHDKADKVRLELEKHGLHPVVMNAKGS